MSTKTTFKRIALVTVAALGMSVVAVAPSSAAVPGATAAKISDVAVSGFVGETLSASVLLTFTGTGALNTDDSVTIGIKLASKPTNATTPDTVTASTVSGVAGITSTIALDAARLVDSATANTVVTNDTTTASKTGMKVTAKTTTETGTAIRVASFQFRPSSPGVYKFTATPSAGTASAGGEYTYTAGTYTFTVLSVGGKTGDGGAVASPYTAVNGVAGPYGYVIVQGTGQSGSSLLKTQVVVTGSTFLYASGGTLSSDKTSIMIDGVAAGTAGTNVTAHVATPTAGTVTVNTYVESAPGVYSTTASSTVTITVRATALSAAYSYNTAYMAPGTTAPTATTDAASVAAATVISVASTLSATTVHANIDVQQYDALDVNLAAAKAVAVTAEITGAGTLGYSGAAVSNVLSFAAATWDSSKTIQVFADGRSGVGTVVVKVNGVVATTRTVSFYGALASYKQDADTSPSKTYIGVGDTGTVSVFTYDANSVKLSSSPTFYATSDTTTVATVPSAVQTGSVTITGIAAGKTNITICNTASCSSATVKLVIPVEVTKTAAKEGGVKLSFDKASYTQGEKMVLTVTAVDTNGRPVADGARALFTSTGLTSNVSFGGASATLPTASVTLEAGIKTYTLYAPSASGTVTVTGTEGAATALTERAAATAAGTTYTAKVPTVSVTVTNASSDAAQAAAEEATAAANDATDAALSAAEAAEAATAMAQEAVDAVAELSAQVTSLISALRAQITALTNLVVKIQKKVKA